MRKIFYLIFLVAGFMSCKKEVPTPQLDSSKFVGPELTQVPTDGPYELKERKGEEEFATVKWSAVDFGISTANKYDLMIAVEGYEGTSRIADTQGLKLDATILNKDLNGALMKIIKPESAIDVKQVKAIISVIGSLDEMQPNPDNAIASATANFMVTPYFQGPTAPPEVEGSYLGVPGDHQGWDPTNKNTRLAELVDGSNIFEGYIVLKSQWKVSQTTGWDGPNYGADGSGWADNGNGGFTTTFDIEPTAGNHAPPAGGGMYYIKLDINAGKLDATKVDWTLEGSALSAPFALQYDPVTYNLVAKTEFLDGDFKIVGSHGVNLGDGGEPNLLAIDGSNFNATAGKHEFYVNLTNAKSLFYRWGTPVAQTPAVITAPVAGTEFILDATKADEVLTNFTWTAATYDGDLLPTEYKIQINDEVIIAGITDLNADITHLEFNIAALNAGFTSGTVNDIPVTVVAVISDEVSVISEPVVLKVTPFENSWGIIGDATPGSWDNSTALTYDGGSDTYSGIVDLVDGSMKFRKNNAWADQLGAANGTTLMGSNDLTRGGNEGVFAITAGKYKIVLSVTNQTAILIPMQSAASWGIIGDATGGGWDTSSNLVLDDATGTYKGTFALVAGSLKFRFDDDWADQLGTATPTPVMGDNPLTRGGNEGTFTMTTGVYTLELDVDGLNVNITKN